MVSTAFDLTFFPFPVLPFLLVQLFTSSFQKIPSMLPSFSFVLTAGLSLTTIAIAAPTARAAGNSFSVEQVKNTKFSRNGPLALAKVYRKYNATLPEGLAAMVKKIKNANKRRSSGSATTTPNEGDSEWLTPVQIGSPAKTFNLDFDTGSSDLWVFSTETTTQGISGHTLYNPNTSNTSKKLTGASWSISYGDGSSSAGDVYLDKVTIGGLSVSSQAVEAAKTVSDTFTSETDLDGLVGLAFSSINTVKPNAQKTFFDSASSQLASKVFTADLKQDAAGKYNFGYIDSSAHTGTIAYTPVDNSDGFWAFTSSGYSIGTNTLNSSPITGIADTGTTLLMLPSAVNEAYYSQVEGAQYDSSAGGYVFSCDATLPAFNFAVGTTKFTIPAKYMNYASLEGSYSKRSDWGQEDDIGEDFGDAFGGFQDSSNLCFGGLQPSDSIGINIFGDIALKAAFVVFDGENTRLGWAAKSTS